MYAPHLLTIYCTRVKWYSHVIITGACYHNLGHFVTTVKIHPQDTFGHFYRKKKLGIISLSKFTYKYHVNFEGFGVS